MGTYLQSFRSFVNEKYNRIVESDEVEMAQETSDVVTRTIIPGEESPVTQPDGTKMCILKEAKFEGDFSDAITTSCDFSNVDVSGVNFQRANFTNCQGFELTKPTEDGRPSFYTIDCRGADFTGVDLSWFEAKYVVNPSAFFQGCTGIDPEFMSKYQKRATVANALGGGWGY